jgi:hypothetical protein
MASWCPPPVEAVVTFIVAPLAGTVEGIKTSLNLDTPNG